LKRQTNEEHSIDMLFLVVIFLIFTFAALSVLLLSVNFYRGTVQQAEANENARSATAYLREVIHQNDSGGGISLDTFDGVECLKVCDADGYVTYVYLLDGELRELYTREGAQVSAENGPRIMKLTSLSMEELDNGAFRFVCEDASGQSETVIISAVSEAGGEP
jgi:hypothetical protein